MVTFNSRCTLCTTLAMNGEEGMVERVKVTGDSEVSPVRVKLEEEKVWFFI